MTSAAASVKREILVRHLETWAPAALHRARRATYVHGYADADPGLAEAALRVFTEQSDLVRGRELTMVALGADTTDVAARLGDLPPAAGLTVHTIAGGTEERLAVALKAAAARGVPSLIFLDASTQDAPPAPATTAALLAGKPAEAIVVLPAGSSAPEARTALRNAGFPLVAAVELAVSDDPGEILLYATGLGRSLDAFKDLLWDVDEFTGVRYRDPGDPDRHRIDISLNPHPGPLRREILAHLTRSGPATVTDLRTFTTAETVYRASDATRVLNALVEAGAVTRTPDHGRLGGDVLITPAP